jgi:hypothetical protein
MTDVALAVAARSFSLGFFGKAGREHTGKNRKDKDYPNKIRTDSIAMDVLHHSIFLIRDSIFNQF